MSGVVLTGFGGEVNTGAILMKPIVAGLSYKDMIDLVSYVGSLEP